MKYVKCPICYSTCIKYVAAKSGFQRWQCRECRNVFTNKIDSNAKQINAFLKWLFGKQTKAEIPVKGRTQGKRCIIWQRGVVKGK